METIAPSREEIRADRLRTQCLGLCRLLRRTSGLVCTISLCGVFVCSLAGCQLGSQQPLSQPPGPKPPQNSTYKPDTIETQQGRPQTQSTNPPVIQAPNDAIRVRGQTPDTWNNTTVGSGDATRRPMQSTDATGTVHNRYTGQSTLQPNGGANRNQAPNTSVPNATPPGGLPPSRNQAPLGLVSTPAGVQTPPNQVPQNQFPQNSVQSQTVYQPPIGSPYQQPMVYPQQPPSNQLPPAYQQQPSVYQPPSQQPQTGLNPYTTTQGYNQGNYPNAVVPPPVAAPSTYQTPGQYDYNATIAPGTAGFPTSPESALAPGAFPNPNDSNSAIATQPFTPYQPRERVAPIDVFVQEARTGRVMLGGSVNSDLGLSGQLTIDERNFDFRRLPRSWDDLWSGRALRGGGQNFRAELMPGTRVQRYTVNWSERNLFGYLPYSLSVGGFLFTRQYTDWTEQRLGGRVALGYEITKDLSISTELRMEDVKIFDPRVLGVQELDRALGSNDLYTGRIRLAHDTRDSPFMSTEGHLLELIYDQVFGEYDYPRGMINYNRYFLVRERPDQTGRHTLASTWKFGLSGSDTPIFENFFAGGYSTLRGFEFRGASPVSGGVQVGGQFMFLGSLEYVFPLTADEMLRGVAFVDYGTVQNDLAINSENFRVAPGLGLRVAIPALGPAPLAFDFAIPVSKSDTDQTQVFSFFMGFTR